MNQWYKMTYEEFLRICQLPYDRITKTYHDDKGVYKVDWSDFTVEFSSKN